jgi:hypothetical protein
MEAGPKELAPASGQPARGRSLSRATSSGSCPRVARPARGAPWTPAGPGGPGSAEPAPRLPGGQSSSRRRAILPTILCGHCRCGPLRRGAIGRVPSGTTDREAPPAHEGHRCHRRGGAGRHRDVRRHLPRALPHVRAAGGARFGHADHLGGSPHRDGPVNGDGQPGSSSPLSATAGQAGDGRGAAASHCRRLTTNRDPPSASIGDSARTVPPMAVASSATIARPSPEPIWRFGPRSAR